MAEQYDSLMSTVNSELLEKFALVDFIEHTDRFLQSIFFWNGWFANMYPREAEEYATEDEKSRQLINEALLSLGGLRLSLEDSDGNIISELSLGTWLGRDPESPDKHLWQPIGASEEGPYLSLGVHALNEIKDKLLSDFEPDV